MRIHLASGTVKVADFPNYNNVVELADKTEIEEGSLYLLLISLGHINNHVTLTDVVVSDIFDNSMWKRDAEDETRYSHWNMEVLLSLYGA